MKICFFPDRACLRGSYFFCASGLVKCGRTFSGFQVPRAGSSDFEFLSTLRARVSLPRFALFCFAFSLLSVCFFSLLLACLQLAFSLFLICFQLAFSLLLVCFQLAFGRAVVRSCSRAPCLNISSYYCGLRGCPDSGRGRYQSALPHLGWRGGILRGLPKAASGRRHITLRIPAGYVGIDGKTRNNEIQQHYLKLPSFRAPFISGKAVAKMLSWLQRSGPICFHELFLR